MSGSRIEAKLNEIDRTFEKELIQITEVKDNEKALNSLEKEVAELVSMDAEQKEALQKRCQNTVKQNNEILNVYFLPSLLSAKEKPKSSYQALSKILFDNSKSAIQILPKKDYISALDVNLLEKIAGEFFSVPERATLGVISKYFSKVMLEKPIKARYFRLPETERVFTKEAGYIMQALPREEGKITLCEVNVKLKEENIYGNENASKILTVFYSSENRPSLFGIPKNRVMDILVIMAILAAISSFSVFFAQDSSESDDTPLFCGLGILILMGIYMFMRFMSNDPIDCSLLSCISADIEHRNASSRLEDAFRRLENVQVPLERPLDLDVNAPEEKHAEEKDDELDFEQGHSQEPAGNSLDVQGEYRMLSLR